MNSKQQTTPDRRSEARVFVFVVDGRWLMRLAMGIDEYEVAANLVMCYYHSTIRCLSVEDNWNKEQGQQGYSGTQGGE